MLRRARRFPRLAAIAVAALALASIANLALARPPYRSSFFNAYPSAVGTRLADLPSHAGHCGQCHFNFNGGGARNSYGRRVESLLGSFPSTDAGRQALYHSIESEDSDGDGYSNLTEITSSVYANTPTFAGLVPGNVDSTSNVPVLAEISPYLVPTLGADTTPPVVAVTSPNGGESFAAGSYHVVTWTATDNVGVSAVDVAYWDSGLARWTLLANAMPNTGAFGWFVHNTPGAFTKVRVIARDAAGNAGADSSNAAFTITAVAGARVPTTLRDFHQPGTQPLEAGGVFESSEACVSCHGGYDPAVEPGGHFQGTMMGQAARDPLFYACLAIAEQDASSSGDLCIRCHSPLGWLFGHSQPTDASQLDAFDRDGVACDVCHRMLNPDYEAGVSPARDLVVLSGMLPAHVPGGYGNGQYVIDADPAKRGPFSDPLAPHLYQHSPFHTSSNFCGTCHDVSNPVFERVAGADYAPGPLDAAVDSVVSSRHFPLERTFSEWANSEFPSGVYAPEFAGNEPTGVVSSCQDCHLRPVQGRGCNDLQAQIRPNLPLHDMTGGNTWMPGVIASLWPFETYPSALADAAARAQALLEKAAQVDVNVAAAGDSFAATVTVTNRTGHKLPTGYPEGRRMWLHLVARDSVGAVIWESGGYDAATGVLDLTPLPVVYEAHLGLSPALASALTLANGPSFHFALNDTVYKDNRIPPRGYTNAAFAAFGGNAVEAGHPAPRYPDGQHWDAPVYGLPRAARRLTAELLYQTTSKDYIEFLRDENSTNTAGQTMYDAWVANGRAAPVWMAADSATFLPTAVETELPTALALSMLVNPFRDLLSARLDLERPAIVSCALLDVQGRVRARRELGLLGAGAQRIDWRPGDGGAALEPGVYWLHVKVDGRGLTRRVVRVN